MRRGGESGRRGRARRGEGDERVPLPPSPPPLAHLVLPLVPCSYLENNTAGKTQSCLRRRLGHSRHSGAIPNHHQHHHHPVCPLKKVGSGRVDTAVLSTVFCHQLYSDPPLCHHLEHNPSIAFSVVFSSLFPFPCVPLTI